MNVHVLVTNDIPPQGLVLPGWEPTVVAEMTVSLVLLSAFGPDAMRALLAPEGNVITLRAAA